MIYVDNEKELFEERFPFYVEIFEQYDNKLSKEFNAELTLRIKDGTYNSSIIIDFHSFPNIKEQEKIDNINEVIRELYSTINTTCNSCGSPYAKYRQVSMRLYSSYMDDELNLCENCFSSLQKETDILVVSSHLYFTNNSKVNDYRKIDIRFIDSYDEFGYARFGTYFFHEGKLYVITPESKYARLDVTKKFPKTFDHPFLGYQYIIEVIYAGQDTGYIDDNDKILYTGDIVITESFYNPERDPYRYFNKERNPLPDKNIHPAKICGVVAAKVVPSMNDEKSYPIDKVYEVVLDNTGAFLVHSVNIEVIGNIYYNLERDEDIDIWHTGGRIAQSGYFEDGFWRKYTIDTVKEELSKIKTPSFKEEKQYDIGFEPKENNSILKLILRFFKR